MTGMNGDIDTGCPRGNVSRETPKRIGKTVGRCRLFVVQGFRPTKALDPAMLVQSTPSVRVMERVRAAVGAMGVPFDTG